MFMLWNPLTVPMIFLWETAFSIICVKQQFLCLEFFLTTRYCFSLRSLCHSSFKMCSYIEDPYEKNNPNCPWCFLIFVLQILHFTSIVEKPCSLQNLHPYPTNHTTIATYRHQVWICYSSLNIYINFFCDKRVDELGNKVPKQGLCGEKDLSTKSKKGAY
jgi:hypothetical protein